MEMGYMQVLLNPHTVLCGLHVWQTPTGGWNGICAGVCGLWLGCGWVVVVG